MRRLRLAPSFRAEIVSAAIVAELGGAKKSGVRIVQYSIQDDHLHLMIEGANSADLSNQMRRLFSRVAFAVNRVAGRSGRVFRDRHHRHELRTPRETRNALVYILFNARKHALRDMAPSAARRIFDALSSAPWFARWHPDARPPTELLERARADAPPGTTSEPRTWLANVGWLRAGGPIRFDEQPRPLR